MKRASLLLFCGVFLLGCGDGTDVVDPDLPMDTSAIIDVDPDLLIDNPVDSFANQDALLPNPVGWVNDYDYLFSEDQRDSISALIEPHNEATGNRIYVVTAPNPDPFETLEQYTVALGNSWNTDSDTTVNTVLIVLCESCEQVRVESTDAYDSDYSDEKSSHVIFGIMMPEFAKQDFFGGIVLGVKETIAYFDLLAAARNENPE